MQHTITFCIYRQASQESPGMSNAALKIAPVRPDPGTSYRTLRDLQGTGRNLWACWKLLSTPINHHHYHHHLACR